MDSVSPSRLHWLLEEDDGHTVLLVNTLRGGAMGRGACAVVTRDEYRSYLRSPDEPQCGAIAKDLRRIGVHDSHVLEMPSDMPAEPGTVELALHIDTVARDVTRSIQCIRDLEQHWPAARLRIRTSELRNSDSLEIAAHIARAVRSGDGRKSERPVDWVPSLWCSDHWEAFPRQLETLVEATNCKSIALQLRASDGSPPTTDEVTAAARACDLIEASGIRSQLVLPWMGDQDGLQRVAALWAARSDTEFDIVPMFQWAGADLRARSAEAVSQLLAVVDDHADCLERLVYCRDILQHALLSQRKRTVTRRYLDPGIGIAKSEHHAAHDMYLLRWPHQPYAPVALPAAWLRVEQLKSQSREVPFPDCRSCKYLAVCDGYYCDEVDVLLRQGESEMAGAVSDFACSLRLGILARFTAGMREMLAGPKFEHTTLRCEDKRITIFATSKEEA